MATKKPGKEMVTWEEELKGYAAETKTEAPALSGGNFLSFRGGKISYKGAEIGAEMRCIIVDFVYENQFYSESFDPDSPSSPSCYAFGRNVDSMKPHEQAEEPQESACKICPHNEFGSAERGKGKACKNVIRLQIVPEDALEDLENAEVAYAKISVTNTKNFAKYYRDNFCDSKAKPESPICRYITELVVKPDGDNQIKVTFLKKEELEKDQIRAIIKKDFGDIDFPYPKFEDKPAPKPRKTSKFARK